MRAAAFVAVCIAVVARRLAWARRRRQLAGPSTPVDGATLLAEMDSYLQALYDRAHDPDRVWLSGADLAGVTAMQRRAMRAC